MDNELYSINGCMVEIMLDNSLTDYDKEVLSRLYQPIVKPQALNILYYLYSLVPNQSREECVSHKQILRTLGLSEKEFVEERKKLEALGLIEVYLQDQIYIYVLKEVLTPYEFFQNEELVQILSGILNKEDINNLAYDLLLRKLEPKNFKNITSSFDEIYNVSFGDETYQFSSVNTKYQGIKVSKKQFNLDHFRLLLESRSNLIDEKYLTNIPFLDEIVRLAFLFGLSVEEMVQACVLSVDSKKEVSKKELIYQIKRIYDGHEIKINVTTKTNKHTSDDSKINALEKISPNELVKNKYNTALTSSEIEMFNELIEKTGIGIGVLNVLIIYVLNQKDGEIPSKPYFEKVINTWIRKGINTTHQALDYINGIETNNNQKKGKRIVPVSSVINNNNNDSNNETELEEDVLGDIFKK